MKNFVFYLFILISINVSSQNQGILWRITREDLKDTSYILGTHHGLQPSIIIPNEIKLSLKKSEVVFTEVKGVNFLSGFEALLNIRSFYKILFNPNFKSLEKYIGKEKYLEIKKTSVLQYKVDSNLFRFYSRFRPLIMVSFFPNIDNKKFIDNKKTKNYSLDDSIRFYGNKYNLKMKHLENMRSISKNFRNVPIQLESDLIFDSIFFYDTFPKQNSQIDSSYLQGISKDFFMKEIDKMSLPELYMNNALLVDRNLKWFPKFEPYLLKKSTFIAVGLDHLLPNKFGLIDLLRLKGYKVECIVTEIKFNPNTP